MHLNVDFSRLVDAARRIGAPQVPFEPPIDVNRGIGEMLPIGRIRIEVDLSEIKVHESGLLILRGRQVVLYIQDQGWSIHSVIADGAKGRKVHVADCDTLQTMRAHGRYERYVATDDDSDNFLVTGQNESGEPVVGEARLRVCKNCLRKLNYRNYVKNRKQVFRAFNWSELFDTYRPYFSVMPSGRAGRSDGAYTPGWGLTSWKCKKERNFTCEDCGVYLGEHPRCLHVHHDNGVKTDNDPSNLKVLCALCHREQPAHEHMHVSPECAKLIADLRPPRRGLQI